jgi:hypothetical protein
MDSRTGHVWQPMGKPRGLALSFSTPVESRPRAAACVPAALQNSLLEIEDTDASFTNWL